jgi:hypothetical protein
MLVLLVLAALAGAALASPAHAGDGDPQPGPEGARYRVEASSAAARLTGTGTLVQARTGGGGTIRIRLVDPRQRSIVLDVGRWSLDYVQSTAPGGSSSTLRLRVRVAAPPGVARCPAGARGAVTLVDGDAVDSVRVRFARSRCAPFARVWSTASGDVVDVRVSLTGAAVRGLL